MASAFVAPKISNIDLAPDDAIWLIEADLDCLKAVLTNPGAFVRDHVRFNGKPAILCEPFVVTFQPTLSNDESDKVYIQGISGTALLTVRYPMPTESKYARMSVFPKDEPHCILKYGSQVYSHLEMSGMNSDKVAEAILKGIMSIESFLDELSELPQIINGVPVSEGEKPLRFRPSRMMSTQFVYQGWSALLPTRFQSGKDSSEDPVTPECSSMSGDCDENGNVWVNGVIIKTYVEPGPSPAPNPDPGPSPSPGPGPESPTSTD